MKSYFVKYFLPSPAPPIQASSVFVLFIIVAFLTKGAEWSSILSPDSRFYWVLAGAFVLLFSMFNSVLLLSASSASLYYRNSLYSFAGLVVVSGAAAYLFSGLSLDEAGSFKWIFMVLTVGYIVFLSIVAAMRTIMELAKRKDTRNFEGRRHRKS